VGRGVRGLIAAGLLGALLSGCGSEGAARFNTTEDLRPGGGGALTFAIPPPGGFLDPLRARTPAAQLITRQLFEPLVSTQRPPYETGEPVPGLALAWSHSRDYRVWAFQLRSGVDFQDGEPFNAAAVSANAGRWISEPDGVALLPGLIAADNPRPGLVRFIFSAPVGDLPERLASPRLGIVSPLAIEASAASGSVASRTGGTGAFRPSEDEGGGEFDFVLQRDPGWWGGRLGLGPALDELIFRLDPDPAERVRLLQEGRVRVAADLSREQAATVRADPLLAVLPGPDWIVALQRSVHGFAGSGPQPLTSVWIALVQTGAAPP
jgi:peptide/nickel transport system substrate-binding protein